MKESLKTQTTNFVTKRWLFNWIKSLSPAINNTCSPDNLRPLVLVHKRTETKTRQQLRESRIDVAKKENN